MIAAPDEVARRGDARVPAHLLVDRERHAGRLGGLHLGERGRVVERERLLAEHVLAGRRDERDDRRLLPGRDGDVHDVDAGRRDQRLRALGDRGHPESSGHVRCLRRVDVVHGHDVQSRGRVGGQMRAADDAAAADDADAHAGARRRPRSASAARARRSSMSWTSSLHRPERQALREAPLHRQHEEDRRDHHEHGHRGHAAPVDRELAREVEQADRERLGRRRARDDARDLVLVPGTRGTRTPTPPRARAARAAGRCARTSASGWRRRRRLRRPARAGCGGRSRPSATP